MYEALYNGKVSDYFNHSRPELVKYIPKGSNRLLDVGCGTGNFGHMLKSLFECTVWGVEPDAGSAKAAEAKLDRVYNTLFDKDTPIPATEKFDCIFFNDVLEHLIQPDEALALASTMLSPTGCVIASIPNIRSYPVMLSLIRYKDFKYVDAGVMDKTHLRFFTQISMKRLFEENGFTVEMIEGINRDKYRWFDLLNNLLFRSLDDMAYPQFVIVARKHSK